MGKSVLMLSWKKVKVIRESKAHNCKIEPRTAVAWALIQRINLLSEKYNLKIYMTKGAYKM